MKRKLLTILLATAACGALIGAVGCTGESSSGGTEWFTGTASPNEQIEADIGDFYLDEDDLDIYRYTADGWTLIGNIKGEDGATGPAGPAGENGEDGKDGADGATGAVTFGKRKNSLTYRFFGHKLIKNSDCLLVVAIFFAL